MDVRNCSKNWEIIKEQLEEVPHQWKHPVSNKDLKKKKKAKQKIHNAEYLISFSRAEQTFYPTLIINILAIIQIGRN